MTDMQESEDWNEGDRISFEQTGSIMATLGFLQENITPQKPDYALFEKLWAMMDGEKYNGVNADDLSYILLVVSGSKFPEREVDV